MTRPNVLVIMLDEWRQSAIGAGSDPVTTPAIDAVRGEGLWFSHAVSTYPVCSPQRAMFFSGRGAHANGVTANCNSVTAPGQQLRPDLRCWPEVLRDAGYRCGYVGKWHLDAPTHADIERERARGHRGIVWDAFTPPERRHGFDYWDAYGSSNDHFATRYWRTDDRAARPGGLTAEDSTIYPGWSAVHDTDSALAFLDTVRSDEPWALVVSYNPPHMPFAQGPSTWREHYATLPPEVLLNRPNVPADRKPVTAAADYFALVSAVDQQIGRLLEGLGDRIDDTLVMITADHGEMLGSHGLMGKNTFYDESLLVPLIIRLPGVVPSGTTDVLIGATDLYPTLLSLLGVPATARPTDLDGRDLSEIVTASASGPRPDGALYVSRQSPWTLDEQGAWHNQRDERGWRTHRWTYVRRRQPHTDELLFDLASDPYQLVNVVDRVGRDRPDTLARLRAELDAELARIGDPWSLIPT